jgi:hypothetical protein
LSDNDASRTFNTFILPSTQYADYEKALNHILLHFDLVTFCSEHQLCDSDIINAFYCEEYRTLRPVFEFSLTYYRSEGIATGSLAKGYFDEKCSQRSSNILGAKS